MSQALFLLSELSPEQRCSVAFFEQKLQHFSTCLISSDSSSIKQILFTNESNQSSKELSALHSDFVIVGQTINIEMLAALFHELSITETAVLRLHPLHLKFGDSAFILSAPQGSANNISSSVLLELSARFHIDIFRVSDVQIGNPGLLVMDMDSTIIDMECIDEIAELAGAGQQVKELTERAMQGELDFTQSLQARVGCLKGVELSLLSSIRDRLPVNPGFKQTIEFLQSNGWFTVIASGGFTYFADYLKDGFGLSDAFSNTLSHKDGHLVGSVEGAIIDGAMKRNVLLDKMSQYGLDKNQTVAIGDGANDLLMMSEAALGVAYKAKPKVKQQAGANIQFCGFEGLLYCLRH